LGDSLTGSAGVQCEVCGKTWPEEQAICPDDGTWLHEQTIMEIKSGRQKRNSLAAFGGTELSMTKPQENSPPAGFKPKPILGEMSIDSPPTTSTDVEPGTVIGEYEIEEKIGEGAMGAVYRAIHPAIHKRVAIKIMTPKLFDEPESVKRFVAEARAVAAIEHPGIVDVFGFGRIADGRTYLVMEWLDGSSLGARLQQGPIPWQEACDIIRQIARALEAAHGKGIVHRDLKPENVFLQQIDDEKPVVRLLDFGLAKTTNKEDAQVAKTRTGQMLGTPLYMSPEQCKSKGVDHRTDIYALGCMAYELLLGKTPFDADNVAELISHHLVAEPPQPTSLKADLDPDLAKLLFGMIQKDPDKRPPLGEVRRVIGMQLSSSSQPMLLVTPPDGVAALTAPPPAKAPDPAPEPPAQAQAEAAKSRLPIFVLIAVALAAAGLAVAFL
jgi:serine/threonine protein kinase